MDRNEDAESIPWGDLLEEAEPGQDLRRIAYMAVGILGAVAFGALVARSWWSPGAPTVIAPATPIAIEAPEPGDLSTGSTPTTSIPPLYSEADLMADPPDPSERIAVARAEWFVTDYFTADYEPTGSGDVRAALPGAADVPDLPQDGRGGISYVEWARAFHVEQASDGAYAVSVAFRALAAPPDGAFIRLPVRAVEVMVGVENEGAAIVDLPRPISLPIGPEAAPWPVAAGEPPPEVVDLAAARASVWGSEPRIVSAAPLEAGWRVVLTVADAVGNRWPLSMIVGA